MTELGSNGSQGITGIWELGLCGAEEEGTSIPVLFLAWCCHGITSGASCAAHPSAHQSWGPLVAVPSPPLSLSAVLPTIVLWCPSECLASILVSTYIPVGSTILVPTIIPVTTHPSPPPSHCWLIPVPPPSFSTLFPQLGLSWYPGRLWWWPWHSMGIMPYVPVLSLERGHHASSPRSPSIIDHRSSVRAQAVPAAMASCP